jgi:hypothetical protein
MATFPRLRHGEGTSSVQECLHTNHGNKVRVEMDGLLHNLARKQQKQLERIEQEHSSSTAPLLPISGEIRPTQEPPEGLATHLAAPTASAISLKGILKTPRVRFPDELEEATSTHHYHDHDSSTSPYQPVIPCELCTLPSQPPNPNPPPSPPPPPPIQPISLFLPTIEKDKHLSEVAYRLYTKFIDELAEFVEIQKNVVTKRLIVQQKRQELKRLRGDVSRSDMEMMNQLRHSMADGMASDYSAIVQCFETAQTARDKVGPCEDEYEPLEVQLGAEEHKLGHKFGMIEARFEAFFNLTAKTTTQQSEQPIEFEDSSVASGGDKEWTGPEAQQGLFHGTIIGGEVGGEVGIGQPPLLAGELPVTTHPAEGVWGMKKPTDPSEAKVELSEKHFSNVAAGEAPQVEDDSFLFGFSDYEDPNDSRQQLRDSRGNRMSQNLEGVGSNTLFETIDHPEHSPMSSDYGQDTDELLLLDEDSETQSVLGDYLTSFEDVRDRINRWLLHQLRLSPREVHALRRSIADYPPANLGWAKAALQQWSYDDLGHEMLSHTNTAVRDRVEPVHMRRRIRPYPDVEAPTSAFSSRADRGGHQPRSELLSDIARATTRNIHDMALSDLQSPGDIGNAFSVLAAI